MSRRVDDGKGSLVDVKGNDNHAAGVFGEAKATENISKNTSKMSTYPAHVSVGSNKMAIVGSLYSGKNCMSRM